MMPVPFKRSATAKYNDQMRNHFQKMNNFHKHRVSDRIPPTAKAMKIGNVQNPYIMTAYEVKTHKEALREIENKLLNFMKTNDFLNGKYNKYMKDVKIGDMIFAQHLETKNYKIKLPAFVCRGLITNINKENGTYNILLVDHGVSIELISGTFYMLPKNLCLDKYLTKIIGVCGILPIYLKRNSSALNGCKAVVAEQWTKEAIQFTKRLLGASKVVYFDHLITDESNGREYGEFYFTIDNVVISLTKALFNNYHALYIEGELLELLEAPTQLEENHWQILYVKTSKGKGKKNERTHISRVKHSQIKFNLSEKILIQSPIDCNVLNDITDLKYPRRIHEGWTENMKSSRPRKIQSYMWPAINMGLNVLAIGSPQCGKTSGCVMAVCGQIAMHRKEIGNSCINNGRLAITPLALILCASSFEVISVQSLCESFLKASNIKSVAAFNGNLDIKIASRMYTGCQILVTTPRYLVRFLNNHKGLLSFDRLSYLVFDNADVILDKYYDSIAELFSKHNIIKNRDPEGDNRPILQTIVSATNCTAKIKKFVQSTMCNLYICIASFIEAVFFFKSIRPLIYIFMSTYKNTRILELLKDDYLAMRTAIVCTNAEEAEQLNTFLILTKKTLLIHENMKSQEIQVLKDTWLSCLDGRYPVLICTDPVLSDLNITNVQWLIHHSILSKSRNEFSYRFSLILDNLTQDAKCKITIIIDENTIGIQLQSIMKILQRMNISIQPEMLKNIQQMAINLEKEKKEYVLCDNIKSFGSCQTQNICKFRHCVLPEIDAPMTNIQINDKLKLRILYIHDTTHFSARILEHIPHSNSEKVTFSNVEYMQIAAQIQSYYGRVENRKMSTSTNIGDICVFEESIDTFKRVQIIRERNVDEDVKTVDLRFIDSGIIYENINVRKLLHVPEEILNLPTHVVEIFLTGLMPADEEYKWNYYTTEQAHKWFTENFDERSYIIGEVRLHLGNTIWLEDLKIGTKLIGHPDLIGSPLKKNLLDGNFAVENNDHLSNLFELCRNSKLTEINGHDIRVTDK